MLNPDVRRYRHPAKSSFRKSCGAIPQPGSAYSDQDPVVVATTFPEPCGQYCSLFKKSGPSGGELRPSYPSDALGVSSGSPHQAIMATLVPIFRRRLPKSKRTIRRIVILNQLGHLARYVSSVVGFGSIATYITARRADAILADIREFRCPRRTYMRRRPAVRVRSMVRAFRKSATGIDRRTRPIAGSPL